MDVSRRSILKAVAVAGAASVIPLTGCSTAKKDANQASAGGSAPGGAVVDMPLWYWGGGLSDAVAKEATGQFATSMKISPQKIEGDFKQKLTTALAAGKGLPGVTGLKGEDIAFYKGSADKFIDLNTLGAGEHKKDFLEWKWSQATTQDGKQIGMPIDIGPTAFFYRVDLFEKAGLPTDPAALADKMRTWDDFITVAEQVKAKTGAFLVSTVSDIFPIFIGQGGNRFVGEDNSFKGDSAAIKEAWERCMTLLAKGLVAKTGKSYQTALQKGTLAGDVGAAWHALDIKDNAKELSGKWKVTFHPGKPANFGGSFLGIPKAAADPKKSMELILWLLKPENGAKGFADASIFPATPASYTMPELTGGDPYFSGQKTIEVFGKAAQDVVKQFEGAADAAVGEPYYTELTNVETGGKDPAKAWEDAVAAARQVAQRQGVK